VEKAKRGRAWAEELRGLSPAQREETVLQTVRTEVARVLSMDAEAVDKDRAFKELGFDSLMAVELRNALAKRVGKALPATVAFEYPTVTGITKYLMEHSTAHHLMTATAGIAPSHNAKPNVSAQDLTVSLSFHRGALPGEPYTATFTEIDGTRVHFIDEGQGPAVLLLHGFLSPLETWKGLIPVLAKRHRVIALDLKGFGWTDRPEGDYSPEAQARLALGLLDQRGIDRVAVIAHSWGAFVALAMALMAKERVSRLALYAALQAEEFRTAPLWIRSSDIARAKAREMLSIGFYDENNVPNDLVDALERAFQHPGTMAATRAVLRDFTAAESSYGLVTQPILLLWGLRDALTPLKYGERLASHLPNAKLVAYPRCGHFPMIEAKSASDSDLLVSFADAW
jgi:2-hydroxymuconate-semialdehyde hydrolase